MKDADLKVKLFEACEFLFTDIKELHESKVEVTEKTGSEIMAVNALANALSIIEKGDAE